MNEHTPLPQHFCTKFLTDKILITLYFQVTYTKYMDKKLSDCSFEIILIIIIVISVRK